MLYCTSEKVHIMLVGQTLSLSLTFMLQDGCLEPVKMEVSTLGECSVDSDFSVAFICLSPTRLLVHRGVSKEFNTEMAGKATAGALMCKRVPMTFDKQRCQHITISRVVEKECDRRCK